MAGVVLETLSNRKLLGLVIGVLVLQVVAFLIGGLIAPAPNSATSLLATKCLGEITEPPLRDWLEPWGQNKCVSIQSIDEVFHDKELVFAVRFPLMRENVQLDMSRWFQNIMAIINVEKVYKNRDLAFPATLHMDARLGYKNKGDDHWTELVRSTETRPLKCEPPEIKDDGYNYHCEVLSLFELGSCHHDYYLVNIRLPMQGGLNSETGRIDDLTLVEIHQNGGFTRVWFALKTFVFPLLLMALAWNAHRVRKLDRQANLLEKSLLCLGCTLVLLDLPVEWLTLWMHMPFMLLFSDIRQGLFYSVLFSFWIIFTGEHLMDQLERNRLVLYWKHLSAVVFGCICLFVFDMCERGIQLQNPFYSVWATTVGMRLALAFIVMAGVAGCCYFLFLCYMVLKVFRNIGAKRESIPSMAKNRRKFYLGLIFRFKFLMFMTLLCAAMTVIAFIIVNVSEGYWKWGADNTVQYNSAMQTGVYAMWNLYVICLLILYAPSHKYKMLQEQSEATRE
ncbi:hypothetical protein CAPTEDRAFT_179639 [Capitella teleta]|uniref:Protein wntless n=1 Tax=Capitella teleta TaxID=283909 RepID=R7UAY2_CAPTE|nr:hypothetical protein CAPTEDRAFT_179639 [Capitella teleta]|eukprot:ELU00943.1 hypothetical protein CAPTEDRAFT_179639 [Capitella teleta]